MRETVETTQDQKRELQSGERHEIDQPKVSSIEPEQNQETSENPYRVILDSISDAIYTVDRDLRIVTVDKQPSLWLENPENQITGQPLLDGFPFLPRRVLDRYDEVFETGNTVVTEETITVNKKNRVVEVRKIPIRENGRITKVFTVLSDKTETRQSQLCLEAAANTTDQKRTEEDAREARGLRKTLFESLPVPLVIMDPETGLLVDCNDAAVRIYGYKSKEEMLGKTPIDVSAQTQYDSSESGLMAAKHIETCWRNGSHEFEWRHRRPNGQVWDADVHMMLFRYHGKPYMQFTLRDITQHRRARDALKRAEAKYCAILENVSIGIYQTTLEGRVVIANPALARMFGYGSPEELIDSITDIATQVYVDPQDRRRITELCLRNGLAEGFETQFYRKHKERRWVSIDMRPVKDAKGKVVYFEGTIEDITERRRAEEALRQSERTLRSLIDATREPVLLIDPEGKILAANEMLAQRLGKSVNEVLGTCQYDYFPLDVAVHRKEEYDRVVRTGKPVHFQDERGGRAYYCYGYPIFDDEGRVAKVAIFAYDITERKALEAQLLQAQKMEAIGTLAGGIAHDFNNILMSIMGYAGLMEAKIPEDDPLRSYVREINKSTNKAANVTRSLLAFSRKQAMELKPLSTNIIIKDVEKLLRRIVPEDVLLTFALKEDVVIMADMTQIDQVLMNLVTNAKDAMPKGGTLHVEAKGVELGREFKQSHGFGEPGRYAMISVADTGSGMDEATQKRIFEPFFTTKEVGKGTGLGLSIVYGIVKQHGGYITVSSQPGRGTTFEIYLPAVNVESISEIGVASNLPEGGDEVLLLAEDDGDVRETAKQILCVSGYTVVEAKDGEDAIKKYVEYRDKIDLVILDVVMPVKNGKEAHDAIRKINPSVRVLFMSGYTGDVVLDKGIQDISVDYISKPLSANQLLKKIREVLGSKQKGTHAA